jgi:Pentapeptide repeats (9 copies)
MDRDETVELFLEGREAWNAWARALLAERKALEEAGSWKLRLKYAGEREEGENRETQTWLDEAFADFSRCLFLMQGVDGTKETPGEIEENGADNGPPVKSIQLEVERFAFDGFLIPSAVWFGSATFKGDASFGSATFKGNAWFDSATFKGNAWFDSAIFKGNASFDSATFKREAWFGSAIFKGNASFYSATFKGNAWFYSATFKGDASFDSATFKGEASFDSATFKGNTSFGSATFKGDASFDSATFKGEASFDCTTFKGNLFFRQTLFKQAATFALSSFNQHASFASSRFEAEASFNAIRGERGFDMADAVFEAVPDFIQAHFEEAPRLDDMKVLGRWITRHRPEGNEPEEPPENEEGEAEEKLVLKGRERGQTARHFGGWVRTWPVRAAKGGWRRLREGDASRPACWRALKRLAIQGHDSGRELEYHARELQSERFETDWPLPFLSRLQARPTSWVGILRFWYGFFYGVLSDFGRSTFRPALLWLATVSAFALVLLSAQPYVAHPAQPLGYTGTALFYARLAPALWRAPPPCYQGMPDSDGEPGKDLAGLEAPVAASTNALREAVRLAFRNGSIFLDGGEGAMHRTYGCLYGIERNSGNPVPFVPGFVTDASGIQKVLSALYIFLFGLALRNMLKMK